ncbi:unnamed protein product [Schistosoma rodhaini]|uniref:Ribosome biogenesis protein NOP53 n=1 Tax=Schistosoma rodhaini TaxID=6188 RepID=A0AA85FQE1_9TREM|nr:unnamed protein product [Schistosoma rodhaini]
MVDLCIKLLLVTLCLQIIPYECQINVVTKVNNSGLSNESTNVSTLSNPVESVSLHYCRSARGINQSDPNSVLKDENIIKVVEHSQQSNVINMRNGTKNHSDDIVHLKYDQPINNQAGSLFDLPVQVNPKAVLDLYSDIKKKGLARRIVKRKKIRYGESANNNKTNMKIITRRIKRVLEKIHSDNASSAEAENKRTVVRVKGKKIANTEDTNTLNDWKSLLRRKKEDMKRVLIKRVKAKKSDEENEIKSTKSKQRIIVNKIRGHLRNLTDNEKKRIRISKLLYCFHF